MIAHRIRPGRAVAAGLAALLLLGASQQQAPPSAAAPRDDLVGTVERTRVVRADDTLLDIAAENDVGYVEIVAANPGIDPWLPPVGTLVAVPTLHVLPDAPRRGIVINLAELRLYWFAAGKPPRSYPIGIGGEGKETPRGSTTVTRKVRNPVWIPTRSEHLEDPDLPERVPPGPDNPMGDYAIYLAWSGYAVHGTNKVYSVGRRDSHGCIRLYPWNIEELWREVAPGTPVTVVDQKVKLGWRDGALFIEIHPGQDAADAIEESGRQPWAGEEEVDAAVAAAAGSATVDWYAVHEAATRRDGRVRRITLATEGNEEAGR